MPETATPDFTVLIPAAGRSLRYTGGQGGRSKLAELLGGIPVLRRAVEAFLCRADVQRVVIACSDIAGARELLGPVAGDGRVVWVEGGSCRAHSVRNALMSVEQASEFVAVHDGARPLVSQALIGRVFAAARRYGAAGPATAVTLTIKQAAPPLPAAIVRTIPRQTLWAMQTPQAMRRSDLAAAFDRCPVALDEITDDLQLLELAGFPAMLVEGEERNLKITHPADLEWAARLIVRTSGED